MLLAGSDDGIYRIAGVTTDDDTRAEKLFDADQLYRLRRFNAVEGVFATAESGLAYAPDGLDWTALSLPADRVYAVTVDPSGNRLYAGARPARVYVADVADGVPTDERAWEELAGFRALRDRADWGIPRHDGVSQVRRLCTHPDAPRRLVAGIEVGGVFVSDDRGETWTDRRIDGFDAPHADDVHHVAMPDAETLVASTGSGLYRSTDTGRTWTRLDVGRRQRYFREACVHDGSIYAGAAPGSSSSWEDDTDHALLESHDGGTLEAVPSPTPAEVALGTTKLDGDVLAATHRGTLLRRGAAGWRIVGEIPTPGSVRGRYLPLSWSGD